MSSLVKIAKIAPSASIVYQFLVFFYTSLVPIIDFGFRLCSCSEKLKTQHIYFESAATKNVRNV